MSTKNYTLSLHDALPISRLRGCTGSSRFFCEGDFRCRDRCRSQLTAASGAISPSRSGLFLAGWSRSEEHTSELQSRENLVCRLLLEKKKTTRQKFSQITD